MTEVKHTPTPWESVQTEEWVHKGTKSPCLTSVAAGENLIADCHQLNGLSAKECEANAAFIVHACNSHYLLVDALEAVKETIENLPKGIGRGSMSPLYIAVESAIAMAKGAA